MADTTTTGAEKEVALDTAKVERRKQYIKYAVIAAVVALAAWLVYKYFIK